MSAVSLSSCLFRRSILHLYNVFAYAAINTPLMVGAEDHDRAVLGWLIAMLDVQVRGETDNPNVCLTRH